MQEFSPKSPDEIVTLRFDFSKSLASGETISSSSVSVVLLDGVDNNPLSMIFGATSVSGTTVNQNITGGAVGATYAIRAVIITSTGQRLADSGMLSIESTGNKRSSLFVREIGIARLRGRTISLASASNHALSSLSDDVIWAKLVAAESQLSGLLGVPLCPTEFFSHQPTDEEVLSLNGGPYQVEPGYDLSPDVFSTAVRGSLALRAAPVIEIKSVDIVYPSMNTAAFSVPLDWIKLDKKYGHIKVFPKTQSVNAPLSIFAVQAIGSGITVPHMIRIRYVAGIDSSNSAYPEIIDLVLRMAVLRMMHDSFIPQSGSISADGLSQSSSMDVGKLQDSCDADIKSLRDRIHGPMFGVL